MRKISLVLSLVLLLGFVAGCTFKHEYVWKEYPIQPAKISAKGSFPGNQELSVIQGESSKEIIFLGDVGPHKYYASEQTLTDGIVEQLSQELIKCGFRIKDGAEKSLEIAVTSSRFDRGLWVISTTLQFTLRLGNGKVKYYIVKNNSPFSVNDTYNGAVAQAVIAIINDPEVLTYIFKKSPIVQKNILLRKERVIVRHMTILFLSKRPSAACSTWKSVRSRERNRAASALLPAGPNERVPRE